MSDSNVPSVMDLLQESPKNWGKWGDDDEVGALNYLGSAEALAGVEQIRTGRSFTLQVPMGHPHGDPVWPGRTGAVRHNVMDRGHYLGGNGTAFDGGAQCADDIMTIFNQGSSQYDALGHFWMGDHIWNGYPAETTTGGLKKASVRALGERGVVGRAVLIDMARHRGKKVLDRGETFNHTDLLAAAAAQGCEINKRDILLIRTGLIGSFYVTPSEVFYENFVEPGLTYSPELVRWFQEMEIPNFGTDTIANEVTVDPVSGVVLPLHNALMRNLGVVFTEILALDALADDCALDGQYSFLYTAAPLKVVEGSGAPVNPIVIK